MEEEYYFHEYLQEQNELAGWRRQEEDEWYFYEQEQEELEDRQ